MDKEIISCVSYPTTIVFVDDDKKFLDRTTYLLGQEYYFKLFTDPQKALKFLKETYQVAPFTNRCFVEDLDSNPDHRVIDFNIRLIREEAFNPNRFKELAVLILDYAMHDMTGGELAKQLKGKPFKIILLTGEADAQTAIKLFNEGVIHSYIRKDDPHLKTLLIQAIRNLQCQYFQDISRVVLENFPNRNWPIDPVYRELFNKISSENNVLESFVVDEFGSCHFLTTDGKSSFLAVANEDMMSSYDLISADYNLPDNIRAGLKSKTLIPFFLNDEDFQISPEEWVPYMHPAHLLKGLENYYYSYIPNPDPSVYKLKGKILSYDEFLASQG